jgi:hypothetical protein
LVHIPEAFKIFGDRLKAIELCVNRFDTETKLAFMDLYSKVDPSVESPQNTASQVVQDGFEGPELRLMVNIHKVATNQWVYSV